MEQAEAPDDPVLAVYKDQTVLRSVVDYQKQTQAALAGVDPATLSDREVVDDLLKNALLLEEAEARGLTPTQEEIEDVRQAIGYVKNMMLEEDQVRELSVCDHFWEIYQGYERYKRETG